MELSAAPLENSLYTDDYTIQKVVYVNSAKHAFSEFKLDESLAIFGSNNKGKTGTLAGTKIILFPEINFKNIEKKFAFKSREGEYYSKEDSYEFYFPSSQTFIILQAKNPHGEFCVVLYKGLDYHYHRAFIPVPFSEIRHWFFDEQTQDLNRDMSIKAVQAGAKKLDGIIVSDEAELVDLMFMGYNYDKRKARFCMVPLQATTDQGVKKAVSAFKSLFNLTFNIEDKSILASAIATLIEMGKSRAKEQLDADLHKLHDRHKSLVEDRAQLDAVEDARSSFEQASSLFEELSPKVEAYSKDFFRLSDFIDENISVVDKSMKVANADFDRAEDAYRGTKKEYIKTRESLVDASTQLKVAEGIYDTFATEVARGSDLVNAYSSEFSQSMIEKEYQSLLEDAQAQVDALSSEAGSEEGFSLLSKELKQLEGEKFAVESNMQIGEKSFLFGLEEDVSNILYQLVRGFRKVNKVTEQFKKDATVFAKHFHIQGNYVMLDGQRVSNIDGRLTIRSKEEMEAELKSIKAKIHRCEDKMEELRDAAKSQTARAEKLKVAEAECKELSDELNCIKSLEGNISKRDAAKSKIPALEEEKRNCEVKFEDVTQSRKAAGERMDAFATVKKDLQVKKQKLNRASEMLIHAKERFLPPAKFKTDNQPWAGEIHDVERDLAALSNTALLLNSMNSEFYQQLAILMDAFLPKSIDSNVRYENALSFDKVLGIMADYELAFNELELSKRRYHERVAEHNQLMNSQKNELINAKSMLTTFIDTINKEISMVNISNLKEISLKAKVSVDFTNLIDVLSGIDLTQTQLVDESVYKRLVEFAEKKMDKRSRTVKMESIIDDIEYSFLLDGKDKFETKGQSGGTSASITALIISVLMKRITPAHVKLHMPLVIDEIKALDSQNAGAMCAQIEGSNFSLLCATPEFDAATVMLTKNFVHMSYHSLDHDLMVPDCSTLTLESHIEGYGEEVVLEGEACTDVDAEASPVDQV